MHAHRAKEYHLVSARTRTHFVVCDRRRLTSLSRNNSMPSLLTMAAFQCP